MNIIKHYRPFSRRTPLTSGSRSAPVATPSPTRNCRRSGTTLILTLGILTVISVLAVTFLLSARLQKQSAVTSRNRQAAESALNTALAYAIQQIEGSLSYPNFIEPKDVPSDGSHQFQRMAPIGRWFSEEYAQTNEFNPTIAFQYNNVLTSPTHSTNSANINLLTPAVLELVPAALTNGLPLYAGDTKPLRSGWIPSDNLPEDAPLEWRLQHKSTRIAYAVFNCSSTVDANVFPGKPTSEKKQRKFYSTTDVAAVLTSGESEIGSYLQTNHLDSVTEENSPFFHTSYDPNPNTFRHQVGSGPNDILGREAFAHVRPLDLNQPNLFQAIGALPSGALPYNKFNINSITNILAQYNSTSVDQWYNDPMFNLQWLLPTILLTDLCRNKNIDAESLAFEQGSRLAWSIANFIDENRIPEISNFTDNEMATRVNYAVEDVPLINKISVFNIFEPERGPSSKSLNYYKVDSSLSNHYAVAVELWYPFAPNPPPYDSACYVGIYTNEADVITSTNRPATSRELQRWFDWNLAGSDQSVMEVLFKSWAVKYRQEVGAGYLANHPLWQEATDQSELWFTPAMTNHPSWPIAGTNGNFSLEGTPVYEALYPDTYDEVSTNAAGIVSTNTYTYTTSTNYWLSMTTPLGATNDFVQGQYGFDHDYMVIRWRDQQTGAQSTTLMSGIINENGDFVPLDYAHNQANHLLFGETPEENYFIYKNADTGELGTNFIAGMMLSPEVDPPVFTLQTNFFNQSEITRVQPLRMPEEFGESLNALINMLPTNNITSFYDFMMLKPDQFSADDWNNLFAYFQDTPSMQSTILPRMREPSLGNLSEKDKYWLYPEGQIDFETVELVDDALSAENFQGYFWTVYPKQTVSFMEVEEKVPIGAPEGSEETEIVTNYYPLGFTMKGNNKPNTIWLRPVVTVIGPNITPPSDEGEGAPLETDRIVDEALLLGEEKVQGWAAVTNLYIPEPRDNAYATVWRPFSEDWDTQNNRTNLSHGVTELPFMHFNGPLQTIGDLGHIYSEYTERYKEEETVRLQIGADGTSSRPGGGRGTRATDNVPYDTLTFATMPGASLLDFFTITPNKQQRGLIQANTTLAPVLDILLSDIQLGWTNNNQAVKVQTQTLPEEMRERWRDLWSEALTNSLYNTGWRSFADMLPELSTNEAQRDISSILHSSGKFHAQHNYTEDVLRGIIDKVSFRQNVFVIILAAQTLAPGMENSENPTVLAEQRAAVTVIRDAYSGNWSIVEWRKLR